MVIEGVDGVGKTTLVHHLKERFKDACFTREPGGSPNAELIRDATFALTDPDPLTETLLFYAARRDHSRTIIKPALDAGMLVITDRYEASTYAYQVGARGLPVRDFYRIRALVPVETPTMYVYLTADGANDRLAVRGATNRLDEVSRENLQRIDAAYGGFFTTYRAPQGFWLVETDSRQDPEALADKVEAEIRKRHNLG